ncbi:MAG: hypothetical protein C0485_01175 [Pirellula sp.]|nr:hypothetical protein [Pirellula sp.]
MSAMSAKCGASFLLADLSNTSVIARGPDDLRLALMAAQQGAVVGRGATGMRVEMSKSDRGSGFRA